MQRHRIWDCSSGPQEQTVEKELNVTSKGFQTNAEETVPSPSPARSVSKSSPWSGATPVVQRVSGNFQKANLGPIRQVHERHPAQNFVRHTLFLTTKASSSLIFTEHINCGMFWVLWLP